MIVIASIIDGYFLCLHPPKKRPDMSVALRTEVEFQYQSLPIFSLIYEFSDILLASFTGENKYFL